MIKNRHICIFIFFISVLILPLTVSASDKAKEKRWADQIVDSLLSGEAVWLQAGNDKFLGIYTESDSDKSLGGAIIVHGIGVHPNWPDVIMPLRSELPQYGWNTLSIQMPILPNEATYKDYAPLFAEVPARMQAAVNFFKQKKISPIVVIAHSLGTDMTATWLGNLPKGNKDIAGYITIGMSVSKDDPMKQKVEAALEKITIPMLDIYGSQDLEEVVKSADMRRAAARKSGNQDYRQDEVPGANHFFNGLDADLVRRVRSWLAKRFDPSMKK